MSNLITILIAEDDDDDTALLKYAFKEVGIKNPVQFVEDGEELLEYLEFTDSGKAERPGLIFLDLNMPKISGHETLKLMKENLLWKDIPVLVFSTSDFKDDIKRVYALGAASYIVKPLKYSNLLAIVRVIKDYWIDTVTLP